MQRRRPRADSLHPPASGARRRRLTRRDLLRTSAAVGLGVALGRYAAGAPAACGAAAPQPGGTLRVGAVADVHTLDPHYSVDWSERPVMYALYNTLGPRRRRLRSPRSWPGPGKSRRTAGPSRSRSRPTSDFMTGPRATRRRSNGTSTLS